MYLITGMHRSGTSIVARLFHEGGGDLGDPDTFYRGDRWNPDGYFEQPDFHSVNMPLINGPWGKLSYFFLPSECKILNRSEKFGEIIKKIDKKYRDKIVKETRFCLTLPAWKKFGADFQKVILCVREPIQVANSLKRRNHIPLNLGLNLWYEHNRRLLEYVKDIPHTIFYFDHLFEPNLSVKEVHHLFSFFQVTIDNETIRAVISRCVKTKMNHYKNIEVNQYPDKIESILNIYKKKYSNSYL